MNRYSISSDDLLRLVAIATGSKAQAGEVIEIVKRADPCDDQIEPVAGQGSSSGVEHFGTTSQTGDGSLTGSSEVQNFLAKDKES